MRGACLLAAVLAAGQGGCSRRPEPDPGAAGEALSGAWCITDVAADERTYHFASPRFLLDSAEGMGPRVLTVTVAGLAEPLVTTTTNVHPSAADITRSVGYSLGEYYFLQASGAYTVDTGVFKRLEAYTNYQRSTWVIRDAACGAVLGQGTSFRPIGVYFQVVNGFDLPIDGVGIVQSVPGCDGCGAPDWPAPSGGGGDGPDADAGVADGGGK